MLSAYSAPVRWLAAFALFLTLAGATAAQPPGSARPAKLRLGQSIVMRGSDVPVRMRFTLLDYRDEVRSPYYRPRRGTKFVVFRLRIANLSRRRWQGTLASWAELVDTKGRTYSVLTPLGQPWPVLAPTLNGGTTIHARRTVTGYLGWVLPKRVELKKFRYNLELGPVTGVWVLPRR